MNNGDYNDNLEGELAIAPEEDEIITPGSSTTLQKD